MISEEKDYGEMRHSWILKIFGDEFSYADLKEFTKDESDYTPVRVTTERKYEYPVDEEGWCFMTVHFGHADGFKHLEKKLLINRHYDMNYLLDVFEEENKEIDQICAKKRAIRNEINELRKIVISLEHEERDAMNRQERMYGTPI